MSALPERVLRLGRRPLARPRLSVLTPFRGDDPTPLLERLADAPEGVEFILLDDGTNRAALLARVIKAAEAMNAPATVIVRAHNCGRAAARNRLLAEAQGEYVLFLDADMLPDNPNFLRIWFSLIECERPFVAFGGLSLAQAKPTRETALHHNIFGHSDCRSAHERQRDAAQFTASANLLVRRDFLNDIKFDPEFAGWGWEDVDWALRAAQHAKIVHVDNPATHVGLDCVDTLMRKSKEAGPNFARLARKHPDAMPRFMSHRVARALKRLPLRAAWRGLCAWLVRRDHAPLPLRSMAFKVYRASYYAEYLP
ncbi:MAG: glycosyltransferase family A protein [Hyphomonadaceae bacterium]|nr:glycosyltransferase family A protein [Hyphomonadaceae bacterium]